MDDKLGPVIRLQGDQRKNCQDYFISHDICDKSNMIIHGF